MPSRRCAVIIVGQILAKLFAYLRQPPVIGEVVAGMELIVLNIGLDLKVLSPTLFSMMVVMALVTTMATSPVLWALRLQTADERELDGLST
jgi:Kef-type K+ transport system membrane component KefB